MLNFNGITFDDFYFNGRWLSDLGGIIAGKDGLSLFSVLPAKEIKSEKIIGRDGEIVYGSSYQPRTFSIPILFSDVSRIREIASWLNVAQPTDFWLKGDGVKLKVLFDSAIDLQAYALQGVVELKFIAHDPYFVELTPTPSVLTTGLDNITVQNVGNVECYPLIKFTGTGDITVDINNSRYRFKSVDQYVYLDCYYYTVFKGDPNNPSGAINKLQNFVKVNELNGVESYPTTMPIFNIGANSIKLVSGTCTEIQIINRNRWI